MDKIMVRYKVKPEKVDDNIRLVKAVYAELKEKSPAGLRYAALVAEDGVTFFHVAFVEADENPIAQIEAFKTFQKNIKDRCDEPPVPTKLSEIGSYNFFC